ncbi:OB-fold-containig protein [Crateriforma spongiae]|uniref:OB-fold-containig protein n=1 Tax=Crateriforma spongiae TaxID=2724528 RepID=UPI00144667F7|nr:OB-fold-containig protein [Crateriforma spongiae]
MPTIPDRPFIPAVFRISMSESIIQFLERLFVGPVWPASVMVGVMLIYAVVVALGLLDFDFGLGADIDPDGMEMDAGDIDLGDADASMETEIPAADGAWQSAADGGTVSGLGAMTVRWLNLGKIPLVIWCSVFTSLFWAVSYAMWYSYDQDHFAPALIPTLLLTTRNVVMATLATKVLTDRLGFLSRRGPTYEAARLIGKTCRVSTSEVSPTFGQGEFTTDAAPLLLNIRTTEGTVPRDGIVRIIDFDSDRRIYTVTAADANAAQD